MSTVFLIIWIALAVWASQALAMAWPYVHLMPQWLLVIALPGVLFRAFDLVWIQSRRQRVTGWKRFAARAVTFLAGFLVAGNLWDVFDRISMSRFEHAMRPLVTQVHANAAAPCPPAGRFPLGPELMAYLDASNAVRAPAELHYDNARFVLVLAGRSMDIDGSSMFYDSRTQRWRKVHNDTLNASGELQDLTRNLQACKLTLR